MQPATSRFFSAHCPLPLLCRILKEENTKQRGETTMTIQDIMQLLPAELLTPDARLDTQDQAVLLTGLNNPQVVRTADMMDMVCIVFVRGKHPSPEVLELAKQRGIAVLATRRTMFSACGILYQAGLRGGGGHD